MQHAWPSTLGSAYRGFQSSSGQRPDATTPNNAACQAVMCFNPHPARRPDATHYASAVDRHGLAIYVSILIRPEGRMQPVPDALRLISRVCRFNPHPARRPDATASRGPPPLAAPYCFNPHPARRPDATAISNTLRAHQPEPWFQSSSGQKAGCNFGLKVKLHVIVVTVSILIRPEGRMQRHHRGFAPRQTGFNPHPARRPDATCCQWALVA